MTFQVMTLDEATKRERQIEVRRDQHSGWHVPHEGGRGGGAVNQQTETFRSRKVKANPEGGSCRPGMQIPLGHDQLGQMWLMG